MHPFMALACEPRRLLAALLFGMLAAFATGMSPAAAVEPMDFRELDRTPRPAPTTEATPPPRMPAVRSSPPPTPRSTPAPTPAATPTPSPAATATPTPVPSPEAPGFDVSYPQCGADLPEAFSFAIVGVNGGRVYSANPCLGMGEAASQLEWAGRDAELYVNTGNPGPRLSSYWPSGQTEPRECDTEDNPGADTIDCAYVYGWNAAEDAYDTALAAYVSLEWVDEDAELLPDDVTIWLDVEPANSWRYDRRLNVAALEGAVAYFESVDVHEIGFYSTPRLWARITGGTDVFEEYPAWHAGARDREDAERRCEEPGFTGGELVMVQWVEDGFDTNHRCP